MTYSVRKSLVLKYNLQAVRIIWKRPSLSESTPYSIYSELTHLDFKASILYNQRIQDTVHHMIIYNFAPCK